MKTKTSKFTMLLSALLGLVAAGSAQGGTLRYQGSGDYTNVLAITGTGGWYDQSVAGSPTTLPGSGDTIRFNYGGNVVTLTSVVPDVARFQAGVDEAGTFVITNGGKITAVGGSANAIGYNRAPVTGTLIVYAGGEIVSSSPLEVGRQGIGNVLIDGGTLTLKSHLWVGSGAGGIGTITITNGGVLNFLGTGGNGMLGLGTIDAVNPSTGQGFIKVQSGGTLKLYNISSGGTSIQSGSTLDISGTGVVTIPGDRAATMTNYVTAGRITAYGGTGTVVIETNSNPGFTTLTATGGYVPPTELTWDPAGNPATTGLWSENANWATNRYKPVAATKVYFNKPGEIPCIINDSASASQIIMGDTGPGGTLIITNTGALACGAENPTVIGSSSTASLVVANGANAAFAGNLMIGLDPGADGTFTMNGGTVSVGGLFTLGFQGGKGTASIKGGTLTVGQWDDFYAISAGSVLDLSGTGKLIINGNRQTSIDYLVALGLITVDGGAGAVKVDYNNINLGQTTVYPSTLVLPPAQVIWNPALNLTPDGLWNNSTNWNIGMVPGNVTTVIFNVLDAAPCLITNAATAGYVMMGDGNGPGGSIIVTNGGSLTTLVTHWTGVGYGSNATLVVENGSSASFAEHLWVGFNPGAEGTVIINGGTVSVNGMFGLGWNGGKGTLQMNGGTLNLAQLHPTDSIKGASTLTMSGNATIVITGNQLTPVSNYIAAGKIVGNAGASLAYSFDSVANKTTIQLAPPKQAVSTVQVSGGNATLTYQTTPGHIYHIESSPTLPATTWTRVTGSTTNATGATVTFSFPTGGEQMYYRTVSP